MSKIPLTFLGDSGVRVSEVCLGTMTFGAQTSSADSHAILDKYAEHGGNFIDTADVYSGTKSESIVGEWLAGRTRTHFVVATKVYFGGPEPNHRGLNRVNLMRSIEGSLSRLQTSYVDLYQIHNWDHHTKVEDWMSTMKDLVQAGKVRMVGVCNVTGWQLQKIVTVGKALGVPIVSAQMQYSLLCREPEYEVLNVAMNENIGWLCWSPLKGGWLTGKFKKSEKPPEDSRIGRVEAGKLAKMQSSPSYAQYDSDQTWDLLESMAAIGKLHEKSVAQVALRWAVQRPGVSCVIIGARTMEQLEDNLGCVGWELSESDMRELLEKSMPNIPYPYEMVWRCSTTNQACRLDGNMFPVKK